MSKDVKVDDVGIYFPLECALSSVYLKNNNLYRKSELNLNPKSKGYFEEKGRVRCQKFLGKYKSEGLYMPLETVKEKWNEKQCFMCIEHNVPEEGCVIRIEGEDFEAYKAKSEAFYLLETKLLDKGETNIEDEQ